MYLQNNIDSPNIHGIFERFIYSILFALAVFLKTPLNKQWSSPLGKKCISS